jgi:hypothetical protein
MKCCKKCKQDRNEKEFSKSRCTKDGLQIWCKVCMKDYGSLKADKEKYNENRKRRRKEGYYTLVEKDKRLKAREDNPEKYMWISCRDRHNKYGIPFNIEISDIKIPQKCPLLEIPIFRSPGKATINSPTVDRIVPELGYVKGNIKVISMKANWMKSSASEEDLKTFYKNIFKYLQIDV